MSWCMVADKYRPDRWGIAGAMVCLRGVPQIGYARHVT